MLKTTQSAHVALLYRKYGATIYARCARLTRNERRASDATVEVFSRVFTELLTTPDEASALRHINRECEVVCTGTSKPSGCFSVVAGA